MEKIAICTKKESKEMEKIAKSLGGKIIENCYRYSNGSNKYILEHWRRIPKNC